MAPGVRAAQSVVDWGRGKMTGSSRRIVLAVSAFVAFVACGTSDVGDQEAGPRTATDSVATDASAPRPELDAAPTSSPAEAGVDAAPSPSPTDGIRNGTETDVDCGGADLATPRCSLYAGCAVDADCAKGRCLPGPGGARCQTAPSCTGAPGTRTCGLAGDEDCCASPAVPAGTVQRLGAWENQAWHPTKVSAFKLDKFEITVGRMRAFFQAMGGNLRAHAPAAGAGASPRIPNSGWRASFDVRLPGSWAEIDGRLGPAGCYMSGDNADGGTATWTSAPGPYEELPITCADWYTLFAFCAWDGGRLPTDAEWLHAARGGEEDRDYAWGKALEPLVWPQHKDLVVTSLIDPSDGLYRFTHGNPFAATDGSGHVVDGPAHIARPGSKLGGGRWGHADLTGNVLEYMLDVAPVPEIDCDADCANVAFPDPPQDQVGLYPGDWRFGEEIDPNVVYPDGYRSLRGGSYDPSHPLQVWFYYKYRVARTYGAAGARCARD